MIIFIFRVDHVYGPRFTGQTGLVAVTRPGLLRADLLAGIFWGKMRISS